MNKHARVIRRHNDDTRYESLRVYLYRQTLVILLTENHLLAMFEYYRVLSALLAVRYPCVRAVIENNAVHKALHDRASLMLLRGYETIDRRRHIDIQCTGEERTSCAEHQLCRHERTLYRTKGRRLGYKAGEY